MNAYLRPASWPVLQSHAQAPFQHQKIDLEPAAHARQGLSRGIFCEVVGPPRQLFVCVPHLDSMIGAESVAFDRIGSIPMRPVPAQQAETLMFESLCLIFAQYCCYLFAATAELNLQRVESAAAAAAGPRGACECH